MLLYSGFYRSASFKDLAILGQNSSNLPKQHQKCCCMCRYVYKAFKYTLFVFSNRVLGKTEYSSTNEPL